MGFNLGKALTGSLVGYLTGGPAGAVAGGLAGGLSEDGDKAAASKADDSAYLSYKAAQDQLAFNKEQYYDWEEVYGPLQDNLSNYYQTLNPERYASIQKAMRQKEYARASDDFSRQMQQRGINDSGIAAQGYRDLEQARAEANVAAMQYGIDKVAQDQLKFLGVGLGNQGALMNNVSNSYGNMANISANNARYYQSVANRAEDQANQSFANAMGAIGQIGGRGGFDEANRWLGEVFGG